MLKLCGLSFFYQGLNMQDIPPFEQVFNKVKDINIAGL